MRPPSNRDQTLIGQVARTIQEHDMIRPHERVLVGLSGGPDSVALVRVLLALRSERPMELGLAHVNHMLRKVEADHDQAFVQDLSEELGLPLYTKRMDVGAMAASSHTSVEEAGRNARYEFFDQLANTREFSKIALGHNRDDNAEQVLLSLIRGTGPRGLKGIPPKRENRFVRPLIRVAKCDILDFLGRMNQPFILDASNEDPAFLRNKIRHHLIPLLETEYNPRIRDSLDRLSGILGEEEAFFQAHTCEGFKACIMGEGEETVDLSIPRLTAFHPALVSRILRKAICQVKKDLRRISLGHIRDARQFMVTAESGKHLDLPGQIRIYKAKNCLTIQKETLPLRRLGRQEKDFRKYGKKNIPTDR